MAEFYEFHGSDLLGIEQKDGHIILRIDAYKHVWPQGLGVGRGTAWTQTIDIAVDEASVEGEFSTFPRPIYMGSLKAKSMSAHAEDIVGDEIPASLSGASDVEICIAGQGDDPSRYNEIKIRGASAAITSRGEARFMTKL